MPERTLSVRILAVWHNVELFSIRSTRWSRFFVCADSFKQASITLTNFYLSRRYSCLPTTVVLPLTMDLNDRLTLARLLGLWLAT